MWYYIHLSCKMCLVIKKIKKFLAIEIINHVIISIFIVCLLFRRFTLKVLLNQTVFAWLTLEAVLRRVLFRWHISSGTLVSFWKTGHMQNMSLIPCTTHHEEAPLGHIRHVSELASQNVSYRKTRLNQHMSSKIHVSQLMTSDMS